MPEPLPTQPRSVRRWLTILIVAAFVVRVLAAILVEQRARAKGSLCLFDDTVIYWKLAEAIRSGGPYVVDQFGVLHFALRTPGYPLFLAICQFLFGVGNTLTPRIVQAAVGAACVPLVYSLTRRALSSDRATRAGLFAATLAAFEPYWVATSAFLLSEAVFVFFMLLMLWALPSVSLRAASLAGFAGGAAVLVKPSWALAPPCILGAWLLLNRDRRTVVRMAFAGLVLVAVMSPWWIRNARVLGRFVPTALWAGASLYDGLNSKADGSSDMRFLELPEFRSLTEVEQDRTLRDAALSFARTNPGRVLQLAVIKAGRFWSPWPNASEFRATWSTIASALITLPIFGLLAIGLWDRRRDVRVWILLAAPLLYFFALHLIFVSSIRYRIPAMVPAFGIVGLGLERLIRSR